MANYPFVHIRQRAALGSELLQKLNDKKCEPDKLMFTLRKNGKSGVSLRQLISTDPIRYQNYALANDFSKGITKIGAGVYGEVFLGCLDQLCKKEIAIKKGKCVKGDLNKEFKIIKMIEGITPNTPIAYSLFKCGQGNCILYLEYIPGGTLQDWLKKNYKHLKPEHLRNIVFQVIYSLKRLQDVYPTFRHNDLKLDNILVNDRASASGYVKYGNKYVPNIGVQPIISDFGMGNIGTLSKKVFNQNPHFKTSYGIAVDNNKLYDVHLFLNSLDNLNLKDPEFNAFLRSIFPVEYLGRQTTSKIQNFRLKYGVDHSSLPSINQILDHPYFNSYKTKQSNVVYAINRKYNKNNLMALRPNRPVKIPIKLPSNFMQVVKPTSPPRRVTFTTPPPLLSPNLPVLPPAPAPTTRPKPGSQTLRNRVVAMKTLKNLKKVATNRKIPGRSQFKTKAQIENLRVAILKNINR
jgi:hypothetical protein